MIFGRISSQYLIYLQIVILLVSISYVYNKIRHANDFRKISLDPNTCNEDSLLDWAAGQGIKGKVSIGSFVFEDLTGD